jgi:chemotaxis signal transduction protein
MAADRNPEGGVLPAEMPLLFFHAAGVALGIEAAAVEGILDTEQARESGIACRNLDELLGAAGASAPAKVLLFKGREDLGGMGIDSLDEIVMIPATALQPLPEPLASFRGPRMFWGGIVRADRIVLLVDVDRLHERSTAIGEALL